jgi:hypothetical protein
MGTMTGGTFVMSAPGPATLEVVYVLANPALCAAVIKVRILSVAQVFGANLATEVPNWERMMEPWEIGRPANFLPMR